MFEEILAMVKEHIGNNPEVAAAIPGEHTDAVHTEIATHISDTLQSQTTVPAASTGFGAGILSQIESSISSGGLATSAITGGLVGSLASKFGLSPAVTGAIAAAIPGLLQKYVNKPSPQTA
jgi:hypothetical protein